MPILHHFDQLRATQWLIFVVTVDVDCAADAANLSMILKMNDDNTDMTIYVCLVLNDNMLLVIASLKIEHVLLKNNCGIHHQDYNST